MCANTPRLLEAESHASHLMWDSHGCRYWIQKVDTDALRWGIFEALLHICQQVDTLVQSRCLLSVAQLGCLEETGGIDCGPCQLFNYTQHP
jgi:hypothetical protein